MDQTTVYNPTHSNRFKILLSKAFPLLLIGMGLCISAYLFYRQLGANTNSKIDVCSTVFGKGCDAALKSQESSQFGLPLSGWGIVYYTTLLLLLIIFGFNKKSGNPFATLSISVITVLGSFASLCLLTLMAIKPSLFCPFCTLIHLINLLLVFLLPRLTGYSVDRIFNSEIYRESFLFAKGEKRTSVLINLSYFLFPICVAAVVYYGLAVTIIKSSTLNNTTFDAQQYVKNFIAQRQITIPVYSDDPIQGDLKAPVQIIVFSDFQCPACRYFSDVLSYLNKQYEGKVQVVFKHFPLGIACNNTIDKDVHPRACEAAWAAEAARQQGKFWEFHDAVFKTDLDAGKETVCSISEKLGLDHHQFEERRISENSKRQVEKTVQLAKQLRIDYTPAVYLNNRLVNDIRLKSMQTLIENAVSNQQ